VNVYMDSAVGFVSFVLIVIMAGLPVLLWWADQ
jgi:hypothetical protein